jgi:hypothetical protein
MGRFDNFDGTGMALGATAVLAGLGMWQQMGGEGSMAKGDVAAAWKRGEYARAGNFYTDGDRIHSYGLMIGFTDDNGDKVLYDYSASGEYKSKTTSQHVGAAREYADQIIDPSYRSLGSQARASDRPGGAPTNDGEREVWVINDEGLYNWQRRSGLSMRNFIRENRDELDRIIDAYLSRPPGY